MQPNLSCLSIVRETGSREISTVTSWDLSLVRSSLTHHLTPGALLGLSSELYGGLCPQSYVQTVCGQNFEPGDVLSPVVAAMLGAVKSRVRGLSEEWLAESVCRHC